MYKTENLTNKIENGSTSTMIAGYRWLLKSELSATETTGLPGEKARVVKLCTFW